LCSLQTALLDQIVSRFGVIFLPQFEEHFGGTPQHMAGLLGVAACSKHLSENHSNHCDTVSTSELGHNVIGLDDARDRVIELLLCEIKLCQAPQCGPDSVDVSQSPIDLQPLLLQEPGCRSIPLLNQYMGDLAHDDGAFAHVAQLLEDWNQLLPQDAQGFVNVAPAVEDVGDPTHGDGAFAHVT
jgi:hypothetical protein